MPLLHSIPGCTAVQQLQSSCRVQVYQHLVFDGRQHKSLRTFPGMQDRCVTIGSAGKTFSFTGWKVGCPRIGACSTIVHVWHAASAWMQPTSHAHTAPCMWPCAAADWMGLHCLPSAAMPGHLLGCSVGLLLEQWELPGMRSEGFLSQCRCRCPTLTACLEWFRQAG